YAQQKNIHPGRCAENALVKRFAKRTVDNQYNGGLIKIPDLFFIPVDPPAKLSMENQAQCYRYDHLKSEFPENSAEVEIRRDDVNHSTDPDGRNKYTQQAGNTGIKDSGR